jgi:Zn-dependent peptidase ImmA (M78 family)
VRFLSQGEAVLDNQKVEQALASLVETVLTRLKEQGITDTFLEKEWSEILRLDKDAEEFCLAAARLGVDPFSPEVSEVESEILRAAEELGGDVFGDFLDAVSPLNIRTGLDWISNASRLISQSASQTSPTISGLRRETRIRREPRGARPWEVGWQQASEVRSLLSTAPRDIFAIDDLVNSQIQPINDRGLQAVGSTSNEATPTVVLGRHQPTRTTRFTLARALWHVLYEDESLFLVTGAYTDRQKMERAFAAELLAPAQGIEERLGESPDVVASEDLEQIADYFQVSPMVVEHQVENQLSASVIG